MIKLVVFDLDNVIIDGEAIDEIGKLANVEDEIAEITEKAMQGEIDFETSIKDRVKLLEGTSIEDIQKVADELPLMNGAEDTIARLKEEGLDVAIISGNLTYYVAECMEFPNLGEYHDNLSLEEAVRIYQEIPAERMNGIKGIGFELKDGSDYEGPFPILTGQTIDLDTIQAIDYYRDNPLVQKAVKELAAAMPEMEVLGADANQQEALFLINDTTYLHIQPCDSGWDYTLYDAASMKELDGGQLDMPELSCMKPAFFLYAQLSESEIPHFRLLAT